MQRIYLDNAATSWPKPEAVYVAVDRYQRECGAPAGRGAYSHASDAERMVSTCRRRLASLIGAGNPNSIIFGLNGTDCLNIALLGLLGPGDHVVTTTVEHNSVLRPLRMLEEYRQVGVTRVACDGQGLIDPQAIRRAIRSNTRLVAVIHASNVTGGIQPIEALGQLCREHGLALLVDAAQSLGHVPIDVEATGIDLLAAPGHKGLMGPLGTGLLYASPRIQPHLQPLRTGGTGTQSDEDRHPEEMPERLEAGNLNMPGLAGLAAGIEWVQQQGVAKLAQHERVLTQQLLDGLREVENITLYGPPLAEQRIGVVSLSLAGLDPREAAAMLDSAHGIQCRAGIHCAPLLAEVFDVTQLGGTLRLSVGAFTTAEEVEQTLTAIGELASSMLF